jgi:hypothetical protein
MAKRFNESLIIHQDSHVLRVQNATGICDNYFRKAQDSLASLDFPNLDAKLEDFKTGGIFFSKEVTKMYAVTPTKSAFEDFGLYFRAQPFGNVVVFSKFITIDLSLIDLFKKDGAEDINRFRRVRNGCKNLAQREEFTALCRLGVYIFYDALAVVDPELDRELIKDKLKESVQ